MEAQLKADLHQAVRLDIQFLRAKFRTFQKELFRNASAGLSADNKLNFKKVLTKIRDLSEMSFERQREQVKMRRKFRYPFAIPPDDPPAGTPHAPPPRPARP